MKPCRAEPKHYTMRSGVIISDIILLWVSFTKTHHMHVNTSTVDNIMVKNLKFLFLSLTSRPTTWMLFASNPNFATHPLAIFYLLLIYHCLVRILLTCFNISTSAIVWVHCNLVVPGVLYVQGLLYREQSEHMTFTNFNTVIVNYIPALQ